MNSMRKVGSPTAVQAFERVQGADAPDAPTDFGRLGLMLHRWNSRRALGELSDQALQDIGLSREQAQREASKPFWLG